MATKKAIAQLAGGAHIAGRQLVFRAETQREHGRMMQDGADPAAIEQRLSELRAAHRALDARIAQLTKEGFGDQLELQRLKKQKLALRDRIALLERLRLPDIIA